MKHKNKRKSKVFQYLQDYRFNSILVKSFLITLAFLAVVFTVVIGMVTAKMNTIIIDEVGSMSVNNLAKTSDRIDLVMDEVIQISGQLSLDKDVQKFMLPDTDAVFDSGVNVNVKNKMKMYANIFDYINSIYIYSHKSKNIVTNEGGGSIEDFLDDNWLENLTEREYEPARMISRVKENKYPNLISYIQPLRLTQMQFLGGIIVNIDSDKLSEMALVDRENKEELLIVDERNNVIFSSNEYYIGRKLQDVEHYNQLEGKSIEGYQITEFEGEEYIVTMASSENLDWNYISSVPMSAIEGNNEDITYFYILLSIIGIILSVVASFGISLYCYTPVKNICELVKNPDLYHANMEGNSGFKKNEIEEISLNIIRNLYSNQQLQNQMKEYTDIMDQAILTALQAQISPHFLYNTLENIRWRAMAICKGDNEVSHIILNLSEMLRNSLDIEQQIITVEQEVRNARLYVEILQLRYEDKLKVIWEIDDEILECAIVKVSLQPIIENAIYHGIKPLRTQGIIWIRAYEHFNSLYVEIEDNGVGIEVDKLNKINMEIHDKYVFSEDHIGIRNVNQRLNLLLGDEAKVYITSEVSKGTKVVFHLPI